MITLKSIEIFNIQNREEKQILLKWNLENGVQRNHSVTIQSPLAVDDVLKALKDLGDILRNDPLLVDEETKKERWKKEYKEVLKIEYRMSEEKAEQVYIESIQNHTYSEIPRDAVYDDMKWR